MHDFDHVVLDHLLEGCQIIGFDYRYLYVNGAAVRHGRRPHDELIGRTMMEMFPGIEHTVMFEALRRCMIERIPAELDNEFQYADGTTSWFSLKLEPVPQGVFILSIDISERKRVERELHQQIRRIRSLHAIDLAIISTTNMIIALQAVLDEAAEHLQIDAADVLVLDPKTHRLEFA